MTKVDPSRKLKSLIAIALILGCFACPLVSVNAQNLQPGPPNDVPELINTVAWTRKYNSDAAYRQRHDNYLMAIRGEIDPANIVVSRFTVARLNLNDLLPDNGRKLSSSVLEEFRITPFADVSIKVSAAKDEQLSELMTGNLVMTGSGRNYWDIADDGDIDWQVTVAIRESKTLESAGIAVNMQLTSKQGSLVIKPVETVISPVPDELRGYYVIIFYQLGGGRGQ